MGESKYARQAAYNRKTYVRFPLDLKPEVLEAFREACKKRGEVPTTEIKKFIQRYIEEAKGAEEAKKEGAGKDGKAGE